MFRAYLSVFFVRAVLAAFLLPLAACGDTDVKLPKVFGTEVPREILDAPRAVPSPPPEEGNPVWPLPGAVPQRPRDFTPQPTINAAKSEMEKDRDAGLLLQQNYQSAPPVVP